jgi:hypothetical protein
MIISTNRDPNLNEFKALVDTATLKLNEHAAENTSYYVKRNAQLLEDDVFAFLDKTAKGTKFEGTIEKISGQRFPDIVAGKYYGVEVKSSKDEDWITLGGSVNESTRVENVERIFLTFGKLIEPIEFRSRPYEDCLSDVVVTHYPRYKIDMKLKKGETIFDKMDTTYDKLRLSGNTVGEIIDYYDSKLGENERLWWIGKDNEKDHIEPTEMTIKFFDTLSPVEKYSLRGQGFAFFPELLSDDKEKYRRFSLWLATEHNLVSSSLRDLFSAGGVGTIEIGNKTFKNVSKIRLNVKRDKEIISQTILNTSEDVLKKYWKNNISNEDRIGQWIKISATSDKELAKILNAIFNRK